MSSLPSLNVQDLSKKFGSQPVLNQLTFQVYPQEIVAMVGESGCGKSTALQIIAGLQEADAGTIHLHHQTVVQDGFSLDPALRQIGMVFQNTALFPHLTVRQNIQFGMVSRTNEPDNEVAYYLDLFSLPGIENKYPHELSGGQQQRIGIARALAAQPRVLLMDEPFSSLDRAHKRELMPELRRILKQNKTTTLVVSHDEEEALALADRLVAMHQGRVVAEGSPEALYHQPLHVSLASYFGPIQRLPILEFRRTPHSLEITTSFGKTMRPPQDWPFDSPPHFLGIRDEQVHLSTTPQKDHSHQGVLLEQRFALPHPYTQVQIHGMPHEASIFYAQGYCKPQGNNLIWVRVDLSQGVLLAQ